MSILWYQNGFSMVADVAWLSGEGGRLVLTDSSEESSCCVCRWRGVSTTIPEFSVIQTPEITKQTPGEGDGMCWRAVAAL